MSPKMSVASASMTYKLCERDFAYNSVAGDTLDLPSKTMDHAASAGRLQKTKKIIGL